MNSIVQAFLPRIDPGAEFERCKPWLEAALAEAGGTHTIDDIRAGIAARRYHFWPGKSSAAITEVFNFPQMRVFNVFLAGGDLEEILTDMEPDFCSFAEYLGCSQIALIGRPGWEKALKPLGWQRTAVVLSKELRQAQTSEV
jgi:hypothetical protein